MEDSEALRLLHRFVARSADAVTPDALWSELCEVAVAVAEADFGNVQQMDADAGLRIVSHRGLPAWWIDFWNAAGRGQGACSQALASGEPIVVEDVEASALFAGSAALQIQLRAGVRAVLSVPMVAASGETVGVLSTHYRKRHRPDQRQLHRLDLLARSAANLLDRRPAAATARHGEARLHALAAATGDAMYVARPGWERLRWLTRQAFVAGLPDDEEGWLGRHVDVADQQQLSEAIRTAIDACGPLDAEVRIHHPDGGLRWVRLRAAPLPDAAGRIVEWCGTAADVTASRRATADQLREQRQLRALLDALPVGVAFTNSPGCEFVTGNRMLLEQFNVRPEHNVSASARDEKAPGRSIVYLHEGTVLRDDQLPLQRAAREGRAVAPMVLQVRLPDGREFFVEARGAPIHDAQGLPMGAVAILLDITERMRVAEAREKARLKDEFLALLGHELRNPLAAIAAALELLNRDVTTAQRQAMEQVLRSQVDVMKRLVDDLLEISRTDLDKLRLDLQSVSLRELLAGAGAAARPLADRRSQTLTVDLPASDVGFRADGVRLAQVLANLLDNASKYSGAGGRIALRGALEGAEIVLRCKDNGPGVDEAAQGRIFHSFVRLDSARRQAPEGLGLGLALVRRIAELHGGSAAVVSDGAGQGCEFVVKLPFVQAALPHPACKSLDGLRASAAFSLAVVEDHPDVAQVLSIAAQRVGYQVVCFNDGASALVGLQGCAPDAVLIDCGLPDRSGVDLLAQLRALPGMEATAFIGMSGAAAVLQDGDVGFDHFLLKPIDVRELAQLLSDRARRSTPAGSG